MGQERIEIKLSKRKAVLTFLGAIAFVVAGIWMIALADNQHRFPPPLLNVTGYSAIILFGAVGLYIFYKMFDSKPGLIIDKDGIHDNSNASSAQLIKWEQIKGLKIEQVMSTKFILIDIHDPEDFMEKIGGLKKKLMKGNYKMYGTPISIISNSLNGDTDYLFKIISERMIAEHNKRDGVMATTQQQNV
ncbi:STM3941 family protein [Chryseosolibacter indicus]|uniref:YfjD family protein n=1 Tax=Chryseosolibacter indicus TaxID=2782351 RepID=A0ABS5VSA2_9BACT|nr:STM3941 family protein [Chryseosolibacter indicus]MBT1704066.1 hypothetical protein [Chryseosolibacter indicus]